MKKFEKTIEIKVSVDSIASNLLTKFDKEFPHAELVVEAIIATALDKNTISHVYNALNGFDVGIDFSIGQHVDCKATTYTNDGYKPIGKSVVTEINQFAEKNVKISFVDYTEKSKEEWVRHSELSNWIEPEVAAV